MDTKTKILIESSKLFTSKGYDKTSITDIISACNITKGGFYHHYTSKNDIYLQSVELIFSTSKKWFEERIIDVKSVDQLLDVFFDFNEYFKHDIAEEVYINRWMIIIDAIKKFPELKTTIKDVYYGNIPFIEEIIIKSQINGEIKDNLNPHSLASQIVFLADSQFYHSVVTGCEKELVNNGLLMKNNLIQMIKKDV